MEIKSSHISIYYYRVGISRALGKHYQDIINFLKKNNLEYTVMSKILSNFQANSILMNRRNILRDYQMEALEKWNAHDKRGCIVLPTGAKKQ